MFETGSPFSGISVDDLEAARHFYGEVLGLSLTERTGGMEVGLPGGGRLWVYPKADHVPATFTVLNFPVADIDAAVDELHARGVSTRIYDDPRLHADEKGIVHGKALGYGPDIAWFTDPAGNVLSVIDGD